MKLLSKVHRKINKGPSVLTKGLVLTLNFKNELKNGNRPYYHLIISMQRAFSGIVLLWAGEAQYFAQTVLTKASV